MALEGGGGGRRRREEEKNGEFRSPGSHIEGTCVLGEPKRTTFSPLLRVFAESKPCAHVCTALDLPWFRHVALQTLVGKPGKRRPLPLAPRYPGHPFSNSVLSPNPRFTMVTYSLAFLYLRCGDLGGVGSGGGGVCRGDIGVPLKGRSEFLRLSPAAPRSSSSPQLVTTSPSFCPCGPQPDTPAAALTPPSFPSGSRAPRVEIQTFPAPENSVSGSLDPLWGFHAKRAFLGYFLDF